MGRFARPKTQIILPNRANRPRFGFVPSVHRRPCCALAPWVKSLWATDCAETEPGTPPFVERVLPTGAMHVVWRLSDAPLTLFGDDGQTSRAVDGGATPDRETTVGHCIVGGARSAFYVKRAGDSVCSVGVQLQPGAALALLGASAAELAEQHTPLDALWGSGAEQLRQQLSALNCRALSVAHGTASLEAVLRARLQHVEAFLLSRLGRFPTRADDGWLTRAVAALEMDAPLGDVVEASGISHRAFITRFRDAVGLTPKVFSRITRFQRVIDALCDALEGDIDAPTARDAGALSLARVALDAGYADQAHLSRDFREFAGISPSAYLRLAPVAPNHVPVR